MLRTTIRDGRHALALAVTLALSGCASTGSITGTLHVPPPARPAARAGVAQSHRTPVSDAVVYIEAAPPGRPEAKPAPAARTVSQHKGGFSPSVLPVTAGTRVVFRNDDAVYHSVFSVSPAKRFDTGMYKPGQRSKPVTFDQPGVVHLFCSLDASMSGHVVVLPHRWFTRPDGRGGFTLAGLPPGSYTVKAWHPTFGVVTRRVDLGRQRPTRLNLHFPDQQAHADR